MDINSNAFGIIGKVESRDQCLIRGHLFIGYLMVSSMLENEEFYRPSTAPAK